MRNRPEETMLMIVRCAPALAIAVGFIFALETVPAARAQVTIDVSKITCDQFVDREVGDPRDIAIWLSGYYHGKRGETTVDKLKLLNEYAKEVRDYCFRNPQTSVMQAVENLIERTR
jgi:hypothetical protein